MFLWLHLKSWRPGWLGTPWATKTRKPEEVPWLKPYFYEHHPEAAMLPVNRELAGLKFLDGVAARLRDVREPHKALRHTLRDTHDFIRATHSCIATLHAGSLEADLLFTLPKHADWDRGVLTRYIRHPHPPVQRDMLLASLWRRGGAWARSR